MDKARAYAIGIGVGGLALFVAFFLPHASTPLIYIVSVLLGLSFAAHWIFPLSMLADVVDFDRLETGHQRGNMFYGVWGLGIKVSEALALVMVGWILSGFGYVPNVEQAPIALLGIRLFFGLLPSLCIFLALSEIAIVAEGATAAIFSERDLISIA